MVSRTVRWWACVGIGVLLAVAGQTPIAAATAAGLPDGLGVVVDAATMARTATLASGELFTVHIVGDTETAPGAGASMRAYQFGLEVDPRLVVTGFTFPPQVIFPHQPSPRDFILGLRECMTLDPGAVLLSISVLLPPEQAGATDLHIDVRPLVDGQEMLYLRCEEEGDLRRFRPAGGVVLNPSAPTIVRLAGSPPVVVEGRIMRLAWECFGADPGGVRLDGTAVAAQGALDLTPTLDTTWTLEATAGALTASRTWSAEVIRRPRVDEFTASRFQQGVQTLVRLSWDVQGADQVTVDGAGQVTALSGALVPLDRELWVLRATNEWGTTSVGAQLDMSDQPPTIVHFTSSPDDPTPGEEVTLSWAILGAEAATITPQPGAVDPAGGTAVVSPSETTSYTLTATNAHGAAEASLVVQLLPPAITWFTARPATFHVGQAVELAWSVSRATAAAISPDVGPVPPAAGSVLVHPQRTTTYTLTVSNALGAAQAVAAVSLLPPGIASFEATPSAIFPGEPTTLTWSVGPGLSVRIDPDVGSVSGATGSVLVTPAASPAVYTLTASNVEGSVSATAEVTWKLPVATFAASNTSPFAVEPILLVATIAGASSASIDPDVGPIPPAGGSFARVVPLPTTFTLTATNAAGSVTRQVTVVPREPTAGLQVSNTTPWPDEEVTLTAAIAGAASASLEPGIGPIPPQSGAFFVHVLQPTTFVLTAENAMGVATATVSVVPKPPVILRFEASPQQVVAGQSCVLTWSTQHATAVEIEPGGLIGLPVTGTVTVDLAATTTYTLTASSTAGAVTATTTVELLPFSIVSFAAVPSTILPGAESTLSWEVVGSADVTIDGIGSQPLVGSLVVRPDVTTDYVLRVRSGALERTRSVHVRVITSPDQSGYLILAWDRDGSGTEPRSIASFTLFDFYVVALQAEGGIEAWECSIHRPAGMLVTGGSLLMPGSTDFGSGDDNFIVGTGGICLQDPAVALLRYSGCLFLTAPPNDTSIAVQGATPSSFQSGGPGYLQCCAGCLREFVVGPPLVLNPSDGPPSTPATAVSLAVQELPQGFLLTWSVAGARPPSCLDLRRLKDGAGAVLLASFEGAQAAAGSWLDVSASPAVSYRYAASALVDGIAVSSPEIAAHRGSDAVTAYSSRVLTNVPNPFNPRTDLRFELGAAADARLNIYDAAGRTVRTVELPALSAGVHTWAWNGEDDAGRPVGSGVYRVQLTAGPYRDARSVTLVR